MKEFMEIEFSTRHAFFFIFVLLLFIVVVFFFGFHMGKRYERSHAEGIVALQQGQVNINKEEPTSQGNEVIKTEKVKSEDSGIPVRPEKEKSTSKPKEPNQIQRRTTMVPDDDLSLLFAEGPLYFVQVGAFKNRDYALVLEKKIQKRGYNVFVIEPKRNFAFFRVIVGGYESEAEAVLLKRDLERTYGERYYIIQHDKK